MKHVTGILRPCNAFLTINPSQHVLRSRKSSTKINASVKIATNSWDSEQCFVNPKAGKLIRHKWMEFQGINDWEGLLDPLDDCLRAEILRYPKCSMLTQCGMGKKGYKVTKSLYATCGVHLPDWADHRIPNWVSNQFSWIGYVAVCNDKNEIARLGRRDVVIAYRGTATCMEWLENLRATLTSLPADMSPDSCEPMVQSGFLSLYTSSRGRRSSLQDSIREEIDRILHKYADEPLSITVTGHSLGAALATLTAHDITTTFKHAPLVTVVSFGGPRVGNKSFRCELEKSGTKVLRIVNCDDPITKVPGFVLEENTTKTSNWLQKAGRRHAVGVRRDRQGAEAKQQRLPTSEQRERRNVPRSQDVSTLGGQSCGQLKLPTQSHSIGRSSTAAFGFR
ncbi:UNVERIFIED_CONTAM: Phospholipase A(1) DAD1, chloroplastic [Sesamum calycinum]|uniref:Phospholipase A(1) DAD1, chloroplastic n=1 Tax=Sesamum calycinum TaxID=2727403 RepID=A0AAW2J5J6_9LAMI